MQSKSYKTKQGDELRSFLESVPGKHITAADVCDYFRRTGKPMGMATVYRQLDKLVDEGVIAKYNIDAGTPACFEYLGTHLSQETCYHCKCSVCGKLIHMHCEELPELQKHILQHHGFAIDPVLTLNSMQSVSAEQAKTLTYLSVMTENLTVLQQALS